MTTIKKVLTLIAAIFTAGICNAQTPTAHNITMTPIVQATAILPFDATAADAPISSYTIETIPSAEQGTLNLNMNSVWMPVSAGMMLTADLANSLAFTPNPAFSGNVVFTYSATDENSVSSNIASYTIPVVSKPTEILPITLLNFAGNLDGSKVQLYWQTTHENNSSYFELQKSSDGNNFETFATSSAKGNTTTVNNYQAADDLFFYHYKKVYYRLKMVETNGSFKYSTVVVITLDATVKNSIIAWPLPFSSSLNVAYNSASDEAVTIILHSVNGAAVLTMNNVAKKGNNTITINQAQSIPAGTYLLTVSSSTNVQTIKVIKN